MTHSQVQREFARQAPGFGDPRLTLARTDYLEWILGYLPLRKDARVLDVAAGTGHVSRAVALRAGRVVAVDLTAEMLRELANHAAVEHLSNLVPVRALAEALPVRDDTFDLVVSRFAFHHLPQPARVVREMTRTCRRGGTIAIIDLVAPDDPSLAERYNHYERLRDPSHALALREDDLQNLMKDAKLEQVTFARRDIEVDVDAWLGLTETPAAEAEQLRRALVAEIEGGERTGMRPFRRGEEVGFLQRWVIGVARKSA